MRRPRAGELMGTPKVDCDYSAAARHLRVGANEHRARAKDILDTEAAVLRLFGPAGLERLMSGTYVGTCAAWAKEYESGAALFDSAADKLMKGASDV